MTRRICKEALEGEQNEEIRWYKGKYKVKVVYKWKPHGFKHPLICLVKTLEPIPMFEDINDGRYWKKKDEEFPTVPRLLWKKPKEVEQK